MDCTRVTNGRPLPGLLLLSKTLLLFMILYFQHVCEVSSCDPLLFLSRNTTVYFTITLCIDMSQISNVLYSVFFGNVTRHKKYRIIKS